MVVLKNGLKMGRNNYFDLPILIFTFLGFLNGAAVSRQLKSKGDYEIDLLSRKTILSTN